MPAKTTRRGVKRGKRKRPAGSGKVKGSGRSLAGDYPSLMQRIAAPAAVLTVFAVGGSVAAIRRALGKAQEKAEKSGRY